MARSSLQRRAVQLLAALLFVAASARGEGAEDLPLDRLLTTEISTASKYSQTMSQAPASVTIISSEEIRRYGWETLADVLQSVRGFYISYDRNYHYIGVRGFSRPTDYNNRLLLLIDGHALNENVFGSAPFGTDFALDLDAFERIEIVRGPGSSLYGTGAMFAVVNLITKKGSEVDGVRGSFEAGSLETRRASVYGGRTLANGVEVTVSGVVSESGGRDVSFPDLGVARDLDYDDYRGVLASVHYRGFTLTANTVERTKGVPTGAYGVDFGDPSFSTRDARSFIEGRYERELGARRKLMARAYVHRNEYEGTYPYDGVQWLDTGDGQWVGGEAQMRFDLRANNRVTAGVEYTHNGSSEYTFSAPGEVGERSDRPFNVFSLYGEEEYQPLENLSFAAGFRYDHYSHLSDVFSPRAAVIWEPARDTAIKLAYGRAYRAPTTYELSYRDPFGGVQGNDDLDPERIDTWEAIVERRLSEALFGVLNVYQYHVDGLVDPNESATGLVFTNVTSVRSRGVEAEVHGRLPGLAWAYASYAVQRTRETRGRITGPVTNSPRQLAKVGLSSPIGDRLHGAIEALYESGRRTVFDTITDSTLVANGNVSVDLPHDLRFSVVVRNLFDSDYSTPGGFEHRQPAIRQDGRTFLFKLDYAF